MTDPEVYLAQLELASTDDLSLLPSGAGYQNDDLKIAEEQAFVNERSIVSFVANVSPTAREDVLDSTLLAALAAEKKHPKNSNPQAWYEAYVEVLTNIGWVQTTNERRNYETKAAEFDVDKAVVEIMTGLVGGPLGQAILIERTLNALRDLADEDGKIKIFELSSQNLDTSNFQVGMVSEEGGAVSLNVSNFVFQTKAGQRRVLFFKWGRDRAQLNYQFFQGTLSPGIYADIRSTVKRKLGVRPTAYIGELEI